MGSVFLLKQAYSYLSFVFVFICISSVFSSGSKFDSHLFHFVLKLSYSLMITSELLFFIIALGYYNIQSSCMDFPYIFSKRGRIVAVTQNWEETEVYTVWDFTLCVQSDQEMLCQLAYSKSKQKIPDAMSGYSSQLSPISQLNHNLWRNKNQPWSFCFILQKIKRQMLVYLVLLTSICQHFSPFCIRTFDKETVLCTLQSTADLNGA